MILDFSRKFKKMFTKQRPATREKFRERTKIFLDNPFDPLLRNHSLRGKYDGYRSIDVAGDIRAVFKQGEGYVLFIAIGTHSELYG